MRDSGAVPILGHEVQMPQAPLPTPSPPALSPSTQPPGTVRWTWFEAPAAWNTNGAWQTLTWADARKRCTQPELWPGGGNVEHARDQLPGLTFARYRHDSREPTPGESLVAGGGARVEANWGLVLEYDDDPTINGEEILRRWAPWRLLAFTTAHHLLPRGDQPAGPRWRVLLPFDRAVDPEELRQLARWARHPRRQAGVIDARIEEPGEWYAAPALAPGGYEHAVRDEGPLLDPAQALAELARWADEARLEQARTVLVGTTIPEAAHSLATREGRTLAWPGWLGLQDLVGPLLPGTLLALTGEVLGARRTLALTLARAAAAAGAPVLHVSTTCPAEEVLGRLLALDPRAPTWRALAQGTVPGAEVERLAAELATACPLLHLWRPEPDLRTWDALRQEWIALAEASDRPGLLIVDDPCDLGPGALPDGGRRAGDRAADRLLALRLRDLAELEVLGHGVAVVAVVDPPFAPRLGADLGLQLALGARGLGELVVATADGPLGRRPLAFDATRGRLGRPAPPPPVAEPTAGPAQA